MVEKISGRALKEKFEIGEEEIKSFFDIDSNGKTSVNISSFVDYVLNKFSFKTVFGTKSDRIYVYQNGIYKLKGEEIIKTFSEEMLGEHCKIYPIREIIEKIKRKTAIDFEDFNKVPINLIPLKNGIFNIETERLIDYNPKIYFKFKLPVEFDLTQQCPTFNKFIEEILYPEDICLVQEWFGFCLYRRYFLKKGMIWVGDPDTGKTTLLSILESLIGEKNCSGLSLQRISANDKFGLSFLHNKLLNSHDDLSSKDLNDGGGFKVATGGGSITGEIKFGDQFKFRNFAKLLFACNKIPPVKDIDDPAYFSRWLPIPFDNQISEEEQDPFLVEKCLQESSGILNWALFGLKRLLVNKRFSFKKNHQEVKALMCRSGKPLYAFAIDVLEEGIESEITVEQMYQIYLFYVKKERLTPLSKEQLGRQLGRVTEYIGKRRTGERFWKNVRINPRYKYGKEVCDILKAN